MKRAIFFGLLVMVLVFGMTVVGCDDGSTNGESDTWSNVTSFSQLNGTWKPQSATYTYDIKDFYGKNWYSDWEDYYGNIKVTESYSSNFTITFNSNAKTVSQSGSVTQAYSGGNIDTAWTEVLKPSEDEEDENITITTNDANHSVTIAFNNASSGESSDDELSSWDYQINQNGTKLKMPGRNPEQILLRTTSL